MIGVSRDQRLLSEGVDLRPKVPIISKQGVHLRTGSVCPHTGETCVTSSDGAGMRKATIGGQIIGLNRAGPIAAFIVVAAILLMWQPPILTADSPPVSVSTPPATADSAAYVTNGTVNAIAHYGSKTYIGGIFTMVGPRIGHGVAISTGDGTATSGFPDVAGGSVFAAMSDGSGGWYIGGSFTQVGGVARNRIAHVNADMSVDSSWNPNADGPIYALTISGTTVIAGGDFVTVDSETRKRIAAIDSDGNVTAWDPNAKNSIVYAVAISGSTVYAGGTFTNIGGQDRNRVAAIDARTGAATAWDPNADNTVRAVSVSGSTVYIGGDFTTVNGATTRNRAAAFSTASDTATAWDPNANGVVHSVAPSCDGSTVYLGGEFTTLTFGAAVFIRRYLAETNASDGSKTVWSPNGLSGGGTVRSLELSCTGSTTNAIYAGGDFTDIGGTTRNHVAEIDTSGNGTGWNPSANKIVRALGLSGSSVFAGGDFTSVGAQTRNNIAELDSSGQLTSCNPNADNELLTVAVAPDGNTVYLGGSFTQVGGQSRNAIAAIDSSCQLTAWDPNASGNVQVLAVSGNTVYAGGNFNGVNSIGGADRNRIAALDASSGAATSWDPDASGNVQVLAVSGNTVYAGGNFNGVNSIGGADRNRIAALDASSGAATSWDPNADGITRALALSPDSNTVYAGGNFTTVGGQTRNSIAAIDASSGTPTSWDPNADATVRTFAVAVDGNTVYAGGNFTTIGGQTRNRLAALDSSTGSATSWDPSADNVIYALLASGPTVYAGGEFDTIGTQSNEGYAQFTAAPTNSTVPSISGSNVAGNTLTCDSGTWDDANATLSYQWLKDGAFISGATSTTHTTSDVDVGASITCQVTATNIGGSSSAIAPPVTIAATPSPDLPVAPAPSTGEGSGPNLTNAKASPRCVRSRYSKSTTKKKSKKSKRTSKADKSRKRKHGSKRTKANRKVGSKLKLKFTLSERSEVTISIRKRKGSHRPSKSCPSKKKKGNATEQPGQYEEVETITQSVDAGSASKSLSLRSESSKRKSRSKDRGAAKSSKTIAFQYSLKVPDMTNGQNVSPPPSAAQSEKQKVVKKKHAIETGTKSKGSQGVRSQVSTSFSRNASAGNNSVDASGSSVLKNLKPGTYKAYISAKNSAGLESTTQAVKFWVLSR